MSGEKGDVAARLVVVPDRSGVWRAVTAGDGKDGDVRLREERVALGVGQWSWHGASLTCGRAGEIAASAVTATDVR